MARGISLILVLMFGVVSSVSAQTQRAIPPSPRSQPSSAKNVPVVLEMRWLATNDAFHERLGPGSEKLPAMGSYAVCDQKRVDRLLWLARGDRRSNESPTQTITLSSGEERKMPLVPSFARKASPIGTSILANVSDDRQAIQVRIAWPKRKDGTDSLPATVATVPRGSHVVIQTHEVIGPGAMPPVSFWQQLKDRFVGQKNVAVGRETQHIFLLISPRIALPGERQSQMAAR
jgi:hypothetical protein